MQRSLFTALVAISAVVGCAQKRPLPLTQRGEVAAPVEITVALKQKLHTRFNLADDGYCLQAVRADKNSKTAIELSGGVCPKEGVAVTALATMEIWGDPDQVHADGSKGALLLAGAALTPTEKSPVGVITKFSRVDADGNKVEGFTIEELCTGRARFDISKQCTITADAQGKAEKFDFVRSATVSLHMFEMVLTHLKNADHIEAELNRLEIELNRLVELAEQAGKRLIEFEKKHGSVAKALEALEQRTVALDGAIAKLGERNDKELNPVSDRIADLERRSSALLAASMTANLDALDTRIKNLEGGLAKVFEADRLQKLSETEQRVADLKTKIETILSQRTSLQLQALADRVNPLKDKVDFLLSQATSDKLKSLEDRVAKVTPELAALEVPERLDKLNKLEKQVTDTEAVVVRLLDAGKLKEVGDLEKRIDTLRGKVDGLLAQATSDQLKVLEDRVTKVTGELVALENADRLNKLTALETQVKAVEAIVVRLLDAAKVKEVSDLETRVNNLRGKIDALLGQITSDQLKSLEDRVTKVTSELGALENADRLKKLGDLETQVKAVEAVVNRLLDNNTTKSISDLEQRVKALRAEIDRQQDQVTQNQLKATLQKLTDSKNAIAQTNTDADAGAERVRKLQADVTAVNREIIELIQGPLSAQLTELEKLVESVDDSVDRLTREQLASVMQSLEETRTDLFGPDALAAVDAKTAENIKALQQRTKKTTQALAGIRARHVARTLESLEKVSADSAKTPTTSQSKRDMVQVFNYSSMLLQHSSQLSAEERNRAEALERQSFGAITVDFAK